MTVTIAIYRQIITVLLWNYPGIFQFRTIEILPKGQTNLSVPVSLWEVPFYWQNRAKHHFSREPDVTTLYQSETEWNGRHAICPGI